MIIKLKPIGFAKNKETEHFGNWGEVMTDLVISDQYADALSGLTGYSHLIIIYWLHKVGSCELRHVPQGKVGKVPKVGIFACRCPQRPNPIGISTVELVNIKKNVVTVRGLDIINATPILDIKPYTREYDFPKGKIKTPRWTKKLEY